MPARLALAAVVDGAAVVLTRPDSGRVLAAAERLGVDPDTALVELARCAVFATACWAALALALVLLATAPGRAGAVGRWGARQLLPAVARRSIAGAVGLGLVLAPTVASARPAGGPTTDAGSMSAPAPAWPTTPGAGPELPKTPVDRPPAPVWPATPTHRPHRVPGGPVTVHPGDSLWTIARTHLGRAPSDHRVAATWPAWWAANRGVIGADPDLIRPGQVLTAPAPSTDHPTDRTPGGTS